MMEQVVTALEQLQLRRPLVHCITNYVTVNDVANAVLAIGGSPIMADDLDEVETITAQAGALVLNLGTLNARTIPSMLAAGKRANAAGVPIVLDPVGAGASKLRGDTTKRLLDELSIAVLRGNLSELSFAVGQASAGKGVDAGEESGAATEIAAEAAKRFGCVAAITGAVDVVSDGKTTHFIHNGHPMLCRVTGTGCMTTGLIGVFAAVSDPMTAAMAGILSMGLAGELAYEAAGAYGTGSFRVALMDAISRMDKATLREKGRLQ